MLETSKPFVRSFSLVISIILLLPFAARAAEEQRCDLHTPVTESHVYNAATFPVIDDDKIRNIADLFETTLEISGDNARERVISHALDWLNGLKAFRGIDHKKFKQILLNSRNKPFTLLEIGDYGKVAFVEETRSGVLSWALLVEHPDQRRHRFWRTNIGLSEEPNGKLHLTINLNLWSRGNLGPQPFIARTAPRFVTSILHDPVLKSSSGSMQVSIEATPLRVADVESFAAAAHDPNRILPIVFVSLFKRTGKPAVDPTELAKNLKGLANVYVEADPQNGYEFANRMDDFAPDLVTTNGFIRIIGRDGEVVGVWSPIRNENLAPDAVLNSVSRLAVARTIFEVTAEAEHRLTSIFDILRRRP